MVNTANNSKKIFLAYLILTLYYLGALVMITTITYTPFAAVRTNFIEHAQVFERYLIWVLYAPGVLMMLASVVLIFNRPANFPTWAVIGSAVLSVISVATMLCNMVPLHHQWTITGFNHQLFDLSKNITLTFQVVPAVLQAVLAMVLMFIYLKSIQLGTRILYISLFVLCFFPMGTIFVECHLNYALWETVSAGDWLEYRRGLYMPVFLSVFLIPFYFPMILLIAMSLKKLDGVSRNLVTVALIALFCVFVVSAAYFVPDIQFVLDKQHSPELIQELIRNEIWMRTPAEAVYWVMVAMMFWRFKVE